MISQKLVDSQLTVDQNVDQGLIECQWSVDQVLNERPSRVDPGLIKDIEGIHQHSIVEAYSTYISVFKRKFFKESLKAGISGGLGCGVQTK